MGDLHPLQGRRSAITRDKSATMHGTSQAVIAISDTSPAIAGAVGQVPGAVATTREAAKVLAR
jgi:methyl-accepting chemotaxis protein